MPRALPNCSSLSLLLLALRPGGANSPQPRATPWVKYNNPVSLQTAPFKPVHGFFTRFNRQTQ